MKTLAILFALVSGTPEKNAVATSEKVTGLHFMITISAETGLLPEIKQQICDTINENEYALFKSKDYILTCRNKNTYTEKGVQTEVKAFFNDEEISMEDAFVMMNNRNVQEGRAYAEFSRERLRKIIQDSDKIKMHYSITLSMINDTSVIRSYCKEYVHSIKESGNQILVTMGKFITFTEVKALYDELTAGGITNISITASEFGKEIPVSSAVGKEQEYLQQLLAVNE